MSVLIKGMKKPILCEHMENGKVHRCPLLDNEDCCKLQDCEDSWTWEDQYAGCPLVEVNNPHGRLIDENEVVNAIYKRIDYLQTHEPFNRKHGDLDLIGILPYIKEIQTVIEATND